MHNCPICSKETRLLGIVDLSRDCLGLFPVGSTFPVEYFLCSTCGFCSAPNLCAWSNKKFRELIYNDQYITIDPDYKELRPTKNAEMLQTLFKDISSIKHLDYGGGSGLLSNLLCKNNWQSYTYDPFIDLVDIKTKYSLINTKFNLITVFEVFEHTTNPKELMQQITSLLSSKGILLFSTEISDNKNILEWNYLAPRNGHISLYSYRSLQILAKQYSLNLASFSRNLHIMWKKLPVWGEHLVKKQ